MFGREAAATSTPGTSLTSTSRLSWPSERPYLTWKMGVQFLLHWQCLSAAPIFLVCSEENPIQCQLRNHMLQRP